MVGWGEVERERERENVYTVLFWEKIINKLWGTKSQPKLLTLIQDSKRSIKIHLLTLQFLHRE